MTGLFLGDRTYEDDDGNEYPGPQYCLAALQDVALYRLVCIGHYDEAQLGDPRRVSASFAARLLRADSAHALAEQEQDRRNQPKHQG